MAGLGKKTFQANEVLSAAEVNGYLMDQSIMRFADASARSSAIGTPTEGMTSYLDSEDRIEIFDGSNWVTNPVSSEDINYPVSYESGSTYTVQTADANKIIVFSNACTVTINASTDFAVGDRVDLVGDGSSLTIEADQASLRGAGASSGEYSLNDQYGIVSILCVNEDNYRIVGNIAVV